MSIDSAALQPTERQRLEQCVREPIRTPGRIQSHGILFAVNRVTERIDVVSENVRGWLGMSVAELESPSLDWVVAAGAHADPVRVDIGDASYDAIVSRIGDRIAVELETHADEPEVPSMSVMSAMRHLGQAASSDELRQRAAEQLREITGFDRVMVYRFFDDGHGEVAAESADPAMESYRGLRFPASDIPQQARSLYITKLSRAIVSTDDPGIPLIPSDPEGIPLDLSRAELRAVSPHHLEFMRNMGQASTVSFSLVHDGRLIGMITCAHRTTRQIPVMLRRALEVFASQLTLQIVATESIANLRRELDAREHRRALLDPVATAEDPLVALLRDEEGLLSLVSADGAIISVDGISRSIGAVPHGDRGVLLDAVGIEPFSTDALPASHPGIAALLPEIAGLLVVPIGVHGVALFLRREVIQTIEWLGDQSESNRNDPLSPRRSFSAWTESVSGTSLPWGHAVEEARTFGREFAATLDRRTEARLAGLALVDALTGLHNRRSLSDRLEKAVAETRAGCVMFLDLDRFKSVNDQYGHEAGDIVLRSVADRLQSFSRADDTVARLGGDEFVVLCLGVDAADQVDLADRLVLEVGQPVEIAPGLVVPVTVSCGVVPLDERRTPRALLDAADAAMYRAKNEGRNRSSQ